MPGDISKHTKYIINLPYPEPKVQRRSVSNANILLGDYSGLISELTAINLYVYQHVSSDGVYDDYAELIGGIAMAEMKHLELLGETIRLLGVKPIYIDSAYCFGKPWSACYINYTTDIRGMLMEDIKAENKAIYNYKYHMNLIDDKYIINLIERILKDEDLHLKLFNKMYEKYSR